MSTWLKRIEQRQEHHDLDLTKRICRECGAEFKDEDFADFCEECAEKLGRVYLEG